MNELIGPLGLPGAVGFLMGAVYFGLRIRQTLTNGHGSGQVPLAYITAQTAALQAVSAHLATLTEKAAHYATKDDIRQFAQENRHAAVAVGDRVQRAVESEVAALGDANDVRHQSVLDRFNALRDQLAARG